MSQVELLAAAREEYTDSEIYPEILQVLQPGNEYLQDLVDQFTRLRSTLPELRDCRIACFFELKASNVGRIVGGRERRDRMVCFFFFFLFSFLFLNDFALTYTGIGVCCRREFGMLGSIRRDGKVFAGLFAF